MELLWRGAAAGPRRGPRQGLSVDAVVVAATDLADAGGLDAVTMRRVAEALNVSPMTLYTYVPGKAELLDLMLDAVHARMPRSDTSRETWRHRVTAIAAENRAMFAVHPWVLGISTARPTLGPGSMAKYEHELLSLEAVGLDDVEIDASLTFLLDFVRSCARGAADANALERASALDDEGWWAANAPLLARVFDSDAYPTAARVGTAAGTAQGSAYSPERAYKFGLERALDGLEALIEGRRGGQDQSAR